MIGAAAAYMSGLFFASFFTFGSGLLLTAAIAVVLFIAARKLGITKGDVIMLSAVFTAAFCISSIYTSQRYDKAVSYDGSTGSFSGEIVSVDYYDQEMASYILEGRINGSFKAKAVYFGDAYEASLGDTLSIESCSFTIPESDYLFDSAGYYKSDGVFLSIEKADGVTLTVNGSRKLINLLLDYKNKIKSDFIIMTGERSGGLLAGMVFGDRENITDSVKTSMYRTGIGHIMAVSGLHVSVIAAVIMLILRKLRVGRYAAFALMNLFVAAMIIMAESPVSALRAAIMLDFMYAAELFRRQNDTLNSLSCAVLIICIFNPYVIYSSGFLLSVSGTFGIGVFAPYMTKNISGDTLIASFFKSVLQMLCVSLCVMPLSILFFDEASLISPLTNVLLVPLCIGIMLIGILYTASGGIISLLSIAGVLADFVFLITDKLSRLEIVYFSCGIDRLFYISMICSGFVLLTYMIFRSRRNTAIAIACAVTVFIFSSTLMSSIQKNKFRIAVLGSGTNAVVVVNYSGRAEAVDLSGHYKSADYLRKYLTANGISELSYLALTEDVHSQYSAYYETLGLVETENLLVLGENKPDESAVLFTSEGFTADNDVYTLSYSEDVLSVEYCGIKVSILPVRKSGDSASDLSVVYGNFTKNTEIIADESTIYLDESEYENTGLNNFEIEIAENGEITLRRL